MRVMSWRSKFSGSSDIICDGRQSDYAVIAGQSQADEICATCVSILVTAVLAC